jgi:signal transduction histidine kinase
MFGNRAGRTCFCAGIFQRRRSTGKRLDIALNIKARMAGSLAGPRVTSSSRAAARSERVLAVGRAFLTVMGLIAIYLDPTEPTRLQGLTYGVLLGYAAYSLAVLAYVHGTARITPLHERALHGLDIMWTSLLTFVSDGPVSPFFLFFLFAVLAAAYRWGFRETVGTAVITLGVFLTEVAVAAAHPFGATWLSSIEFELNRMILRVAYLMLTGVLLGYLAEQDKHSRAELAALAAAAKQLQVNLGLGASINAVASMLGRTFGPSSVSIVMSDCESGRTTLWHLENARAELTGRPAKRRELNPQERAAWLFETPGRAWYAVIGHDPDATFRATEKDTWPLARSRHPLPEPIVRDAGAATLMSVDLGLPSEWQARAYLFDVRIRGGLERRLHFLEELADHVTPALTNVFLLRRLRARAGAAERARVARELHDGAIQALFGVEMKIEAVRREPHRPPTQIDAELEGIQSLLRREVLALRELMQALRPTELDSSEQLPDVLAGLVERFRRDTGISARFVAVGPRLALPSATAIEIVRIVQEALVNVRKHSQARNVLVRLSNGRDGCSLVIDDDGRGFDFEGRFSGRELDGRRIGPAIIKERARLARADLAIDSTPGTGARVELTFGKETHV